jgi:hypothetical protein
VGGSRENCNESLGSIEGGEFVEYVSDYQPLKEDFVL